MTLIRTHSRIDPTTLLLPNQCQNEDLKWLGTLELYFNGENFVLSPILGKIKDTENKFQDESTAHIFQADTRDLKLSNKYECLRSSNKGNVIGAQASSKSIQVLRAMVCHLNCKADEISKFELSNRTLDIFTEEWGAEHARHTRKKPKRFSQQLAAERLRFEPKTSAILISWLLKHLPSPYPSPQEKKHLASKTGLHITQIQHWFINIRKRHLAPLKSGKRKPRSFLDFLLCALWSLNGNSTAGKKQMASEEGVQSYGNQFSEAAADFLQGVHSQTFLNMDEEDSQKLLEILGMNSAVLRPAMQFHP